MPRTAIEEDWMMDPVVFGRAVSSGRLQPCGITPAGSIVMKIVTGFELMEFEPIVLHWQCRGARHDWSSYVVLPR